MVLFCDVTDEVDDVSLERRIVTFAHDGRIFLCRRESMQPMTKCAICRIGG